jgi:signal peptidase I
MSDHEFESTFTPRSETHNKKKQKKEKKKKTFAQELVSTFFTIIIFTGIFLFIQRYLFAPVDVEGDSMEPTLSHEDRLILNKMGEIERFDIIVFPAPDDPDKQYIKRVIGLPGDELQYRNDVLYIDGQPVEEPYLEGLEDAEGLYNYTTGDFSLETLYGEEVIPEEQYFVLGDNRLNSKDSRAFGFVEEESIIGKTSLRIWPFEEIGFINGNVEEVGSE